MRRRQIEIEKEEEDEKKASWMQRIKRKWRLGFRWNRIGWDGIGLDRRRWDKTKHPVIEG